MIRPLALDLFCKAGGAARGIDRAGFRVVGVDIEPQPNYPFEFIRADALEVLAACLDRGAWYARLGDAPWAGSIDDFRSVQFIWASPPCQRFTTLRHAPGAKGEEHPDLITPLRPLLQRSGRLWVIENVEEARHAMIDPVMYCGTSFGLGVTLDDAQGRRRYELRSHRLFEANFDLPKAPCQHNRENATIGVYGGHVRCRSKKFGGRGTRDFVGYDKDALAADALGLPRRSMTMDEYSNAIPPAYAHRIARRAMERLGL